jgi:FkbM family methyltransferase
MLRTLYRTLIRARLPRIFLRHCRAKILTCLGQPDPYHDIISLIKAFRCDLFLDIGCHQGSVSARLLEAGVQIPVLAVDPFPSNLSIAKATLARYKNVTFVEAAISSSDGEASFFINRNEQTSSLLNNAQGNIKSFRQDTEHEQTITVVTLSLDSLIKRYSPNARRIIIKSDTQGAEGHVIRGGLSIIRDSVCGFYGEFMLGHMYENQASFEELRDLLENQCGMVLREIYPCLHDPQGVAVQADALWVSTNALQSLNGFSKNALKDWQRRP